MTFRAIKPMDLPGARARAESLELENKRLRDRIEQLEEALGLLAPVPTSFGLTRSEARVFSVLMKRDLATKELVMLALYAGRPDDEAEIEIITVYICKMRAKMKPFDIPIETVWGQGYRLLPKAKARVKEIMRAEGLPA